MFRVLAIYNFTGGLNLKLFTGLTGLGDKYLAEIYCKIIYYKMNQFEARSILTTSMEKYSSRKWFWIFRHVGILATKYRNMKICWNPQLYCPIHLYLIFEKSSWKNQVQRIGFLACKNQFRNWFLQATQAVKIQFDTD
jgi:hypothetical protein